LAKKKVKTKAEKKRLQTIAEMPCYACFQDGVETQSEVHHIRSLKRGSGMGLRPSHFDTIPLCSGHHRTNKISVHLGKIEFEKRYGTQLEILEKVNREIERCKRQIADIF
tara:strand:+ start:327 stop:656 length:330 start_codon:yes stop_codon:yes gene_type:complete